MDSEDVRRLDTTDAIPVQSLFGGSPRGPSPAGNNAAAFALAETYRSFSRGPGLVREQAHPVAGSFTERHLQCLWFDPRYRPDNLTTADGEPVLITSPGRWNLEAGPDFLDATLLIGRQKCPIRGDIEIHIHPEDWKRHHHDTDPAYAGVIAHVTFHAGPLPVTALPSHAIQIALRDAIEKTPNFFFDAIDTAAYPYATWTTGKHPRLAHLTHATDALTLLHAAGEERIRRRAIRLEPLLRPAGLEQRLYEELATALGYKHNSAPFLTLAHAVPLQAVLEAYSDSPLRAYALLVGVAGLLPAGDVIFEDPSTRAFVRSLWDYWWKMASSWTQCRMPPTGWHLSGLRPVNHPLRRLAALTAFATGIPQWRHSILEAGNATDQTWINACLSLLNVTDPTGFWSHRLSLSSARRPEPAALVGAGRRVAILSNILLPLRAACGHDITSLLHHLPAEQDNHKIRHAANALLGSDHNPALYNRDGLAQQGLIQIFHDYILNHRPGCDPSRTIPPAG